MALSGSPMKDGADAYSSSRAEGSNPSAAGERLPTQTTAGLAFEEDGSEDGGLEARIEEGSRHDGGPKEDRRDWGPASKEEGAPSYGTNLDSDLGIDRVPVQGAGRIPVQGAAGCRVVRRAIREVDRVTDQGSGQGGLSIAIGSPRS